jgi:hypothetical protein
MRGSLLNASDRLAGRVVYTASTYDNDMKRAFFHVLDTSDPHTFNVKYAAWIALDLETLQVISHVRQQTLPYVDYVPHAFECVYVPEINQLVVATTGNFDGLYYVDPNTGAVSWAAFDPTQFQRNMGFHYEVAGQFTNDLWRNMVYDHNKQTILFQCSQLQDGAYVTGFYYTPGFKGVSKPFEFAWIDAALSPLNFGYSNMHRLDCIGKCPT